MLHARGRLNARLFQGRSGRSKGPSPICVQLSRPKSASSGATAPVSICTFISGSRVAQ